MDLMISVKDLGLILIGVALIVFLIFLIATLSNLIKTLKKTNQILDDVAVVSQIASNKATAVDELVDTAVDTGKDFITSLKDNPTIIAAVNSIANGISSIFVSKKKRKKKIDSEVFHEDAAMCAESMQNMVKDTENVSDDEVLIDKQEIKIDIEKN